MATISVVIPVYNAESCIGELYDRLVRSLELVTNDFELLFVEDCSPDQSWDRIRELAARDKRIKGLKFSRNFGQHHSIAAGLDHCDAEWVVIIDCDLQDPPEAIPQLLAKARDVYDVVLARRSEGAGNWLRQLMTRAFAGVFETLTGRHYDHRVGAFRLLSRRVVLAYRQFTEKTRLLGPAIDWLGFPTVHVDVARSPRYAGESAYSIAKLIGLAADGIMAYSDRPLRMCVKLGMIISVTSLLVGLALIIYTFVGGHPVPGWTSVIVSIYFLSGLIIAIVGMCGMYIAKIFEETKNRPHYIVQDRIGDFPARRYHFTR